MASIHARAIWRPRQECQERQLPKLNQGCERDTLLRFSINQINGLRFGPGHELGRASKQNAGAAATASGVELFAKAQNLHPHYTTIGSMLASEVQANV